MWKVRVFLGLLMALLVVQPSMAEAKRKKAPKSSSKKPKEKKAEVRAGILFQASLGGSAELETFKGNEELSSESDNEITKGVVGFAMWPMNRYFQIGFQVGGHWWLVEAQTEGRSNVDANVFVDLSPAIKIRYPFLKKAEAYLSVPFGLTLSLMDKDSAEQDSAAKISGFGYGYNIALLFGAGYRFYKSLEIHVDLGWQRWGVAHDYQDSSAQFDFLSDQFLFRTGLSYFF